MATTHHTLPVILLTIGNDTVEHTISPSGAASPELVISSRVGFTGEMVHRPYLISPPLPEAVRDDPRQFLQHLIDVLKYQNYAKDEDLWVTRVLYANGNTLVKLDAPLTAMEKYLFEFISPKRIHLDITPREDQ